MQILSTHTPGAVTLTQASISFIKRMIRLAGEGVEAGFRLTVTPGGCSGLQASFTVVAQPESTDEVLTIGGVRLFVPSSCRPLLDGVTIDFEDTSTRTGFVFTDPKASACGCGPEEPSFLSTKVS